ncbi:MAG TPA: 6-phosphogluconolactonase [Candidatus Obscuribacterales bacterium]
MDTFKLGRATINICKDASDVARRLAERFLELARQAAAGNGRFTVALSGGSTPRALYSLLATPDWRDAVPWHQIHLFWGDERCVAHDSTESNFKMVNDTLILKVPIPQANVHATSGQDRDPAGAALRYEEEIKRFFNLEAGQFPCFDLILLGMGPDGHTASLFPGSQGLQENKRIVVANFVDKFNTYRITLTLPAINQAQNVIFMVAGGDKSRMLSTVLQSPQVVLPAQMIAPAAGTLAWFVDEAAAAELNRQSLVPVT